MAFLDDSRTTTWLRKPREDPETHPRRKKKGKSNKRCASHLPTPPPLLSWQAWAKFQRVDLRSLHELANFLLRPCSLLRLVCATLGSTSQDLHVYYPPLSTQWNGLKRHLECASAGTQGYGPIASNVPIVRRGRRIVLQKSERRREGY